MVLGRISTWYLVFWCVEVLLGFEGGALGPPPCGHPSSLPAPRRSLGGERMKGDSEKKKNADEMSTDVRIVSSVSSQTLINSDQVFHFVL